MSAAPLDCIRSYFGELRPETMDRLDQHYSPDVEFRDPINHGHGLDDLRLIFEDLFKQLSDVRIDVTSASGNAETGFLRWTMNYRFRGKARTLEGVSQFTFGSDGKVARQEDFWDAAFGVYAEFPLVGATLRGLRKVVRVAGG
ncbi:transcriptional regulator [Haloferula helveola]|uniref:Transcriptional regulator n=1 Tax=Haloferula helveola TaxID=490095 RepID=A0ABM7R7I9_9BACT|nr:transcriptional regulator [Haloferula helveola]